MDNFFAAVLTGTSPYAADPRTQAIAERFALLTLTEKEGDYIYDGNRCLPENLGWRCLQNFGDVTPEDVAAGKHDSQIEATWHDAASAEHWYTYEKDWGFDYE